MFDQVHSSPIMLLGIKGIQSIGHELGVQFIDMLLKRKQIDHVNILSKMFKILIQRLLIITFILYIFKINFEVPRYSSLKNGRNTLYNI